MLFFYTYFPMTDDDTMTCSPIVALVFKKISEQSEHQQDQRRTSSISQWLHRV